MRYPKWFARRRVRVWDAKLRMYQQGWNTPAPDGPYDGPLDAVPTDLFWQRLVTHALAKRTLWRKRAGVRKHPRCRTCGAAGDQNHKPACFGATITERTQPPGHLDWENYRTNRPD